MYNKRKVGSWYEKLAASYLKEQGVAILEYNYRCKAGEIDIIGKQDGAYLFVEIKYRSSTGSGYPVEAVTGRKQNTICKTADYYRMKNNIGDNSPCRFDIIAILEEDITWIQNAFYYRER